MSNSGWSTVGGNRGVGDGGRSSQSSPRSQAGSYQNQGGKVGGDGPRSGSGSYGGGGGGYSRGGGGGRAPASLTPVTGEWPRPVRAETLQHHPLGWLSAANLVPPAGKEPGTSFGRKIPITVNSVEAKITLGDSYYQYDVDIDLSDVCKKAKKARKEKKITGAPNLAAELENLSLSDDAPKPKLWHKIMKLAVPRIEAEHLRLSNHNMRIASDFSKALYSTKPLMMISESNTEYCFQISLNELPLNENNNDVYAIVVKQSALINTRGAQECFTNLYEYINKGKTVPANMADIERVINVAIKTEPSLAFTSVGRASFFPTPDTDGFSLGGGVVNWTGFSLIYSLGWKCFINIDVANSAFILGQTVYKCLDELFKPNQGRIPDADPRDVRKWTEKDFRRATELMGNTGIFYYNDNTRISRKVKDLMRNPAMECTFMVNDERGNAKKTNVEEYFLTAHNRKLEYPYGLCLLVGATAVIPAELCSIEKGQSYTKKLSDAQTAAMIKDTAKAPSDRLKAVNGFLQRANFNNDGVLKEFKLVTKKQLHNMDVRVLDPPDLLYRDKTTNSLKALKPGTDGVWSPPDSVFVYEAAHQGKKISWAVVSFKERGRTVLERSNLQSFIKGMIDEAGRMGLNLGSVSEVMSTFREVEGTQHAKLVDHIHALSDYNFVLCVLATTDAANYNHIKTTAETEAFVKKVGVLTQCIVARNVNAGRKAVIENLLKKLNAKMGGVNHLVKHDPFSKLDFMMECPIMILGADVTHPQQGSKFPSIAAVTASYERTCQKYMMSCVAQKRAERGAAEVIEGLQSIVEQMIKAFVLTTKFKPRKILFFRDGVGDGQFSEVLATEMMAIRRACLAVDKQVYKYATNDIALGESDGTNQPDGTYQPKITFIAVQKRHKTRFFPVNSSDGVGKPKNCPPGTIVDKDIVNARTTDFYVLSHTGIQGTSKPSRYQVLWDDSNFLMDDLERLSFNLCFGYARCDRSVSYPAPTYYAHLACTRAKAYALTRPESELDDLSKINAAMKIAKSIIKSAPMHFI